ncbi:hypothetical protein RND81_09G188400 [Saponaria officinalis]|uniref:MULE transposase domain-containing protein n=1 Tax=Saponaria officinalis TaxID=3572 RepID=A0AAW1INT9_SAPOF
MVQTCEPLVWSMVWPCVPHVWTMVQPCVPHVCTMVQTYVPHNNLVGDGIDYSSKFISNISSSTRQEAYKWAKTVAKENRFDLCVTSVKTKPVSLLKVVYIGCDRTNGNRCRMKDPAKPLRKNTASKKCLCTFRLKIKEECAGVIVVQPITGRHNHRLIVYRDGHTGQAALDDEQKEYVLNQAGAQVKPGKIRLVLHVHSSNKPQPGIRQIYNLTSKFRAEERAGRNRAQQMFYLAAVNLFRAYPSLVGIDSTYKTNLYGMPLVELIGVTPVGKIFTIAYALVETETTEGYTWVLEKLRSLLSNNVVPNAIVTDRDKGLIAAIPIVFPDTYHLLCTFHIYNAVEARAREAVGDNDQVNAITYGRWAKVVDAGTEHQMLRAWDDLQFNFVVVQYLDTYQCFVDKATC